MSASPAEEQAAQTETPLPASGRKQVVIRDLPIELDSSIRTVWVDSMNVLGYEETATATLFFHTAVAFPESAMRRQEVARLQMSMDHVHQMIDVLAKYFDHYPERESGEPDNSDNAEIEE